MASQVHPWSCKEHCLHPHSSRWNGEMFVGVQDGCALVRSQNSGQYWVGHAALENGGVIPCAAHTKVALHVWTDTDHHATQGELPLPSPAIHSRDIHVQGPTLWSWMAMLLQYWQDHISMPLYGGRVRKASELAKVLMRDINPWLPHHSRFSWEYIANHCTLWLDVQEQFVEEHFQEWEAQKTPPYQLGPLEHDSELIGILSRGRWRWTLWDSREEEAKKLPPKHQAAHEQWQRQAMPAWTDICSDEMEG